MASELVPTIADSALALRAESAEPGATLALGERSSDSLLYVDSGSGASASVRKNTRSARAAQHSSSRARRRRSPQRPTSRSWWRR